MDDLKDLFTLSLNTARFACQMLCGLTDQSIRSHCYSKSLPNEMKAIADQVLEKEILERLVPTGLPVLSEEKGETPGHNESGLRFIVDPLDGTVNFVRGLGPAAVSIALLKNKEPIFGVLGMYPSGKLAWGGKGQGAFLDEQPILVSKVSDSKHAVLCTGIPSRFEFNDKKCSSLLFKTMKQYGKTRMLGSASHSLLQVAKGAADLYCEYDIMMWDVAAGLAIVEGAGGIFSIMPGRTPYSKNVAASNGLISLSQISS